MNESGLRHYLGKKLRAAFPKAHIIAIENDVLPGTPDMNLCINGAEYWVELKFLDKWPIRPQTPVKIKHFTPVQRLFLRQRWNAGGASFLLLKVGETRQYLLFIGAHCQGIGETLTTASLLTMAEKVWHNQVDAKELIQIMKETRDAALF